MEINLVIFEQELCVCHYIDNPSRALYSERSVSFPLSLFLNGSPGDGLYTGIFLSGGGQRGHSPLEF